ncbi:trypco2 family protein [Modestobacter marinus]|uniref:trypco2 family protein n=1 Tax=Modestobacter marinus TaxID=477641 RepID=UPI001C9880AA|nr:trypco2 family protein [Modestobacter marinus]
MAGSGRDAEDGIGLADAIAMLRDDLLQARAAGAGAEIQLPVQSMTVELKVTATRKADGTAGFKVPIINVELGGSGGW